MKTPLNYTGNKSRLVEEFKLHFPQEIGTFVDLFCGGGAVGLSVDAKKVILIDNNKQVIDLLSYLATCDLDQLLLRLEKIIGNFGLSYSAQNKYSSYREGILSGDNNGLKSHNTTGFYLMREHYNALDDKSSNEAQDLLYLLMVYGFNNDMRFNRAGNYNLPVGKTDLNKSNIKKLQDYIARTKTRKYEFVCSDFRSERVERILSSADFIYADPPYLIGRAVYNENGNWTNAEEAELLSLFEKLHSQGKKLAFSNVLSRVDRENQLLKNWNLFRRNDFHILDIVYHYRSASYNKKNRNAGEREVLITNFKHATDIK
jgi:DNA adenine methylase Dam